MKAYSWFLTNLALFLVFFSASVGFLYTGVYSEETAYPNSGAVLISEVRPSGGSGKSNDEYVELYNPSTGPKIIGGYSLFKQTKSASSTDRQVLFVFPAGTVMPGHAHVLVAHSDYLGETPDFRYTGQALSDDNTVLLINDLGEIIDLVGYGLAKNVETGAADAPTTQLLSLERRPGGSLGNRQDTNNNHEDFFRVQSNPQNLSSEAVPAVFVPEPAPTTTPVIIEIIFPTTTVSSSSSTANTSTTTPTLVPTSTPVTVPTTTAVVTPTTTTSAISSPVITTVTPTVTTTTPTTTVVNPVYTIGSVLINELYPIPESGQNEFVELFNPTALGIDLAGWFLTEGSNAKTTLSGILNSNNYLVVEKPKGSLNNTGDTVKLMAPNNVVIDQVTYGEWTDGGAEHAPLPEAGMSLGRIQGDTDHDAVDFGISTTVTKGEKNVYTPIETEDTAEAEEAPIITISTEKTTSTSTKLVKPGPIYPRVVYQAKGKVGEDLVFDATPTTGGQGLRLYVWEMDDGVILQGEKITHQFGEAGNYSVGLSVFDETGIEKHKTIKVVIGEVAEVGEEKIKTVVPSVKTGKKTAGAAYVALTELKTVKTNTAVRTRGVLAGVFTTKTNPEFYLIAESGAGGAAGGIVVKTKSSNLDARLGDTVELTGKYVVNNSGNYLQFAATDQLSLVSSGEVITPVSSTIKEAKELSGGYVKISGEVIEKKSGYLYVGDQTGEIKVAITTNDKKAGDAVIVSGFIVKTKDGNELRLISNDDIQMQLVPVKPEVKTAPAEPKQINGVIVLVIVVIGGIMYALKKFLTHKKLLTLKTERE